MTSFYLLTIDSQGINVKHSSCKRSVFKALSICCRYTTSIGTSSYTEKIKDKMT